MLYNEKKKMLIIICTLVISCHLLFNIIKCSHWSWSFLVQVSCIPLEVYDSL